MIDNGFPLTTEPNILREMIAPPNIVSKMLSVVTGNSSNVSDILPGATASCVPWRPTDVKYANNEVYVDLVEEMDAIINRCISILTFGSNFTFSQKYFNALVGLIIQVFHIVRSYFLLSGFCTTALSSFLFCTHGSGMGSWWNVRFMVKFKWTASFQVFLIWLFLLQTHLSCMMWDFIPVFGFDLGSPNKFCHLFLLMDSLSSWVTGAWC